ncbi:hypothetical protein KSS87_021575 [Heliosperma pusillum]|nr:hypothetical protein KSS87_021575 [Heliosperma pusillum]
MEICHTKQPPQIPTRHVVAMPSPGRGHINPMLNLCKLLLLTNPNDLLITFVVTQEWLAFLSSDSEPPPPPNLRFSAVPQVIPSEHGRAADFLGFFEAVLTKLEDPFEQLLDRLQPPASIIIYDSYLYWAVRVANRRNIRAAAFSTMSASFATVFVHFDLLVKHGHFPLDVSVGGFWTHCGWNSTSEGIYAGVPMLTCPIFWDQIPNSKLIVNDLKIGWRVLKTGVEPEKVLTRQDVADLVKKFMDSESDERKAMVVRAKNASDTFKRAVEDGGSAASDFVSFINNI